jgi:hypothetical protein
MLFTLIGGNILNVNNNEDRRIIWLFRGETLDNWCKLNNDPAEWHIKNGLITVGKGDILSKVKFSDAFIHLEFKVPYMPDAIGQSKGNSGVYIQGLYEIQVLDSYGFEKPGKGDCGAIYCQHAPLVNACKPAEEWQTYDIIFRSSRLNNLGEKIENARITVLQNNIVIQNNVDLIRPTSGSVGVNEGEPGPILLQDHGNKVQYRNIWLMHLPFKGSDSYDPN